MSMLSEPSGCLHEVHVASQENSTTIFFYIIGTGVHDIDPVDIKPARSLHSYIPAVFLCGSHVHSSTKVTWGCIAGSVTSTAVFNMKFSTFTIIVSYIVLT